MAAAVPLFAAREGEAAYAEVAVTEAPPAGPDVFTYALTREQAARVRPGHRVLVPFAGRARPVPGVVFAVRAECALPPGRVRPVAALCEEEPLFGPHELDLARFVAATTAAPLGAAARLLLPPGAAQGLGERLVPVYHAVEGAEPGAALRRAPAQRAAWEAIRAEPGLPLAELARRGCTRTAVAALVRRGLVRARPAPLGRLPLGAAAETAEARPVALSPEQEEAVRAVAAAVDPPRHEAFLLWGVTGSGKTEVYLRVIERVLAAGRQAVVLVPEIALTPQTVGRFRARFGAAVAVLHSGLGAGERHDEWWRVRRGQARVVVGARSAVFAPAPALGIVVVDEEHEPSYRQEEAPRYHAREVALWRGRHLGVPVLLGSATPDVGTFERAARGEFRRLDLPRRAAGRPLPAVRVVDMRAARGAGPNPGSPPAQGSPPPGRPLFSAELAEAVTRHLGAGGQVLLFLNRRGFAPVLLCAACGFVARCQACAVSLCYHASEAALRCHYCGARRPVPRACPRCGGHLLRLRGAGTERVAAEVQRLWPGARVLRLDLDTSRAKGAPRAIYEAFRRGEADVLVGTQMVAKGWDVAGVTLVGVVDADTGLYRPDYRSAERTFQVLCQVAGRAGRGPAAGEVVVQTFCPDHPAVRAAAAHDYAAFARGELAERRRAGFPPFASLVRLLAWAPRAAEAEGAARDLAAALAAQGLPPGVDVWGPGEAPLARLRGQYRWHLALRGPDGAALRRLARAAAARVGRARPEARVAVDPDPLSML